MADGTQVEWLKTCFEALKALHAITENYYTQNDIKEEFAEKTQCELSEIITETISAQPSVDTCNPTDKSTKNCSLYNAIKEDKAKPLEYRFVKPTRTTPGGHVVDMISSKKVIKGNFACMECYFRKRVLFLLDKIDYVPLEVSMKIEVGGGNKHVLNLVGVRSESTNSVNENDTNKEKIKDYNVLLFKYKDVESKSDVMLLVARLKDEVEFLEVVLKNGLYVINQKEIIPILSSDEAEVIFLNIKDLFFKNDNSDIVSLESEFKNTIETAFKFISKVDLVSIPERISRIVLQKKKDLKEEEKELQESKDSKEGEKIISFDVKFKIPFLSQEHTNITMKVAFGVIATFILIFVVRESIRPGPKVYKRVAVL